MVTIRYPHDTIQRYLRRDTMRIAILAENCKMDQLMSYIVSLLSILRVMLT